MRATILMLCLAWSFTVPVCGAEDRKPDAFPRKVDGSGVKNVYQLADGLYSGSKPNGEEGFAFLAKLGVKTVLSVDGAAPEVDMAKKHGIGYVHVPVSTEGIKDTQARRIVKAAAERPSPLYVHCHYGMNRGPSASAIICIAQHGWTAEQAVAWMKKAGTSSSCTGLFRDVRNFKTSSETKTYTNPVGDTPLHMGDPFVLQHDGTYYLFGTTSTNEGFRYWESSDLVRWNPKGFAYRKTQDSWGQSLYWAPEVKQHRGKFYMTYSARLKGVEPMRLLMALAVSNKPGGPYQDLHAPRFDFGYSAIDGHIFVDDDGKPYLYFSRNGAQDGYSYGIMYGVALADDLSQPLGQPAKLMEADQAWEKVNYARNRCNEGASVIKHHGKYYMTYSANSTGSPSYGIGYATADKPLGPWVKSKDNPIAATNLALGVSAPGHNSITRSPDGSEMFIVYHTHADPKKPSGDRVVNIDRLYFDEAGDFKIKGPTRSPQPMPSGCR